jgi:hypothetical protein
MTSPDLQICHQRVPSNYPLGNLNRFLYQGGASIKLSSKEKQRIESGSLGQPLTERVTVLESIKEHLESKLNAGSSVESVKGILDRLSAFYKFIDQKELSATESDLDKAFLEYAEHLFSLSHTKKPEIKKETAYGYAQVLGTVFSSVLGVEGEGLMLKTRLRKPRKGKKRQVKQLKSKILKKHSCSDHSL